MTHVSEKTKQAIIKKALCRNGQTLTEIARANNLAISTLSTWLKKAAKTGEEEVVIKSTAAKASLSLAERFKHLLATSGQEDAIISAYCRKHGLYPHQLTQWEADFMTSTAKPEKHKNNSELKELRAENKALKHIISRKDKVLAETVALLVLKKKATQIWGGNEED
jgi:transposase-like protein